MGVKYKVVQRRDPSKSTPADAKLYYAQSAASGFCDFEELCSTVADRSTATAGDVKLVIDGLLFVLRTRLLAGNIVQLGDLGNFRAVLGSSGVAQKEDFNASLIRCNIRFYPGKLLMETRKNIRVERVDQPTDPEDPDGI